MSFAIVVSSKDPAGMNIKESLLELEPFSEDGDFEGSSIFKHESLPVRLYTASEESVHCENIDVAEDRIIFATKHQSKHGIPSLSVHTPGNWAKAEFGGRDRKLCIAMPLLLRKAYLELVRLGEHMKHEIVNECTHHGPYTEKPVMFIEIGSTEEQWKETEAGKIIATAIINTIKEEAEPAESVLAIGGLHTCPSFNKVIQRTGIAISHTCPKYMLENLDDEMIRQAMERSEPKPEYVLLDWKGLKQEKARVVAMLDSLNVPFKRTDKLL